LQKETDASAVCNIPFESSVNVMKVRIITGVSCALFAIMLVVFTGLGYQGALSIPIGIMGAIAAYEMMRVSKCKNKVLTAASMVMAVAYPIFIDFNLQQYIPVPASVILIVYIVVLLAIMLKYYEKTKFEYVAFAIFGSLIIPAALSTIFSVRNLFDDYPEIFQRSHSVYLILFAMFSAWISDTFAYFVGSKFGKHKLTPKISPKKSVEGAIGGVVGNVIVCVIAFIICDRFFFVTDTLRLWMVIVASPIVSVLGMMGDLSASVIKRNFGEKDFGNLFPGHGGVLDRIDSFIVTMPVTYALVQILIAFAGK